jgi:hypothetical protein
VLPELLHLQQIGVLCRSKQVQSLQFQKWFALANTLHDHPAAVSFSSVYSACRAVQLHTRAVDVFLLVVAAASVTCEIASSSILSAFCYGKPQSKNIEHIPLLSGAMPRERAPCCIHDVS